MAPFSCRIPKNILAQQMTSALKHTLAAIVTVMFLLPRADAQQPIQYGPWTPTYVNWYCSARGDGNYCTLFAYGEQLAVTTGPLQAYAGYQVLKGRSAGYGLPLVKAIAVMNCDRIAPTHVQCIATDAVKLAPGVIPLTSTTGGAATLNVYLPTPGPLFDWDGDGRISADREGLLLLRYLLGFKGASLTLGITLATGKTGDSVYADIAAGVTNGWFEFATPGQPALALREGALFQRCLSGLRGTALTAGFGTVNATTATTRCNALVSLE